MNKKQAVEAYVALLNSYSSEIKAAENMSDLLELGRKYMHQLGDMYSELAFSLPD